MRRLRWLIALTSALLLLLAGSASAVRPPSDPPVDPTLAIEGLIVDCLANGHLKATATVSAGDQTSLEEISLVIFEHRFVPAGTGEYYPFDTMLGVAQWSDGVSSDSEAPGKPSTGLSNPTEFVLRTADGLGHFWNMVLSDGTPDAGSWFEVQVHAWGESTERGGGYVGIDRTDFVNCSTGELMENAKEPWEDFNYTEEG